jgi:putative flippase GtrA
VDRAFGPGPVRDGSSRGNQGLRRHLAPEHSEPLLAGTEPAKKVDLQRLQVEQIEEFVEGGGHPPILACDERGLDSCSLGNVATTIPDLLGKLRGPEGQKLFRYSMASVVAVIISLILLVIFDGLIGLSAVVSSTLATSIAAIPSYEMNRKWAWGKTGRSHLWKEVIPFWALALLGWAFSTVCVRYMESYARRHHFSHPVETLTVAVVYLGAFGVLWIGKFIIFNKVLFAHHPEDLPPALDGRTGVPG